MRGKVSRVEADFIHTVEIDADVVVGVQFANNECRAEIKTSQVESILVNVVVVPAVLSNWHRLNLFE